MPVRTFKIGYATGQSGRRDSSDSRASQGSGTNGNYANFIEPFPAFAPSPTSSASSAIEPFPAPKTPPLGKVSLPDVPPADYAKMVMLQAKVKQVSSGDSLILTSAKGNGAERTLSLAYSTAPHIKKGSDEKGAWEARDALSKLVVGKVIRFSVLYTIPNTKREYGIVFLEDGRRLPEEMIKDGWLKLRDDAGRKEDSEEALQQLGHLRLLEAQARNDDKGLWAPKFTGVEVQHEIGDPKKFLEDYKGKELEAIVERVLSGDRMLLRLIVSPTKHSQGKMLRYPIFRNVIDKSSHDTACWNSRSYYRTSQPVEWPNSAS